MPDNELENLQSEVERIAEEAGANRVAVAFYDYEKDEGWGYREREWFHAASTIKIPALLGVFAAVQDLGLSLDARVHVRNRFFSIVDGTPFRVQLSRDGNTAVHEAIGKTMRIQDLARHMIVTSSNLATNLLLDLVGVPAVRQTLDGLGVQGVDLRRGVEDELAYQEGINNQVQAAGLVQVLRLMEEGKAVSEDASKSMLDILHQQEYRSGIPAGLPDEARVANKTGEISTVAHDAGLVYLPDRAPYALAILSEWDAESSSGRRETLARISSAVYQHLTGAE